LVAWCIDRDPHAGVVCVVTGPAGVGKSRLALAVAKSLPASWEAGRLLNGTHGIVERIVAAGDPTLVIVDDADRVPDLDVLISQAGRHPDLIRLLLLTRNEGGLLSSTDSVLLDTARVEPLEPIGKSGDRRRWYQEAVRAYARVLRVSPPDLPDQPVGLDEDTLLLLHARALLAVLGREGNHTWSLAAVIRELVRLEQRSWELDLPRLPRGCDIEVLTQAIVLQLILPAESVEMAAALLRRIPQFSHDAANESRVTVARWARRRYPPGLDDKLDLRPPLVAERLLVDSLRRDTLLCDNDEPAAAFALTRAYDSFPDALDVLTALIAHDHKILVAALNSIFDTGVVDPLLDHALSVLISNADTETRLQLLDVDPPAGFLHVWIQLGQLHVEHLRDLAARDYDRHCPDLAAELQHLAISQNEVGRYREALDASVEAVEIRRGLTEQEPAHHRPLLADALRVLAVGLNGVGRHREAHDAVGEAVEIIRDLAEQEPARHRPYLAHALHDLAIVKDEIGLYGEALDAGGEAVEILRELARHDPATYCSHLADTLRALAGALLEAGRYLEALEVAEEAVAIQRDLAARESARHRPGFSYALETLAAVLGELKRYREALEAAEEAVAIRRDLAEQEPAPHRPHLAQGLRSIAVALKEVGRYREALEVAEEAVAMLRDLAEREPVRYRRDLAITLRTLAGALVELERYREALKIGENGIAILRDLTEREPTRYRPDLALSLRNQAIFLHEAGQHREAHKPIGEAVAMLRDLAEQEPIRHRPGLANALQNRAVLLARAGKIEESILAIRESVSVWRAAVDHDPEIHQVQYEDALALRRIIEERRHDTDTPLFHLHG
jgi:tetratricopeptide (TPR) repeat protein